MAKLIRSVTKRFVLQIGFSCNARCRFCYYKESLKKGTVRDYTLEEVKTKLREGRFLGKEMVDISGGEPTIRGDIFEIINYARRIGYKKVCLITNGMRLADKKVCEKLVAAGMNEILLSIHSPIEKDHDWLTRVPGSYNKIVEALEHLDSINKECNREKVSIRINSTISGFNYKTINKLFELVKPYNPAAVNILILNPSNETLAGGDEGVAIVNYSEVAHEIVKSIERYKDEFRTINVRWLPFCLLPGHEDKIRTMWQKMYEDEEWDPYMNIKYNKGIVAVIASFLAGCFLYPFKAPKGGDKDAYTKFNEILSIFRGFYYYKHVKECKRCSLKKICPGLARDYIKKFGSKDVGLKAYQFEKIVKDPLIFCKKYINNFESLRMSDK